MKNSEIDEFLYALDDKWNHVAGKIKWTKTGDNYYIDFTTGNDMTNQTIVENLIADSRWITITSWDEKGNFSGRINR